MPVSTAFCRKGLPVLSSKKFLKSLTDLPKTLENRVAYLISPIMGKLDKGAAVGATLSVLAMDPALAEDRPNPDVRLVANTTAEQVTDCVAFVKDQRKTAKQNGIAMSRKDQKLLLLECQGGQLQARIAEQKQILAELDEEIRHLDLRIDENARILDENGRAIAQIVAINGQWVIQRQLQSDIAASKDRQEQMLREAERILQRLATW